MTWHESLPIVVFGVTFIASVLSGMIGGGGGYIITPFLIAIGLTPQQAIATSKLNALGLDGGSITAFQGKIKANRRLTLYLIFASLLIGLLSSILIRKIKNENLQLVIGTLNLMMIPFIFIKHNKLKSRRAHYVFQTIGFLIFLVIMLIQGITSSGIGSLINALLIVFFGCSALQANILKRKASIAMDIVVVAGLLGSGLINYRYGLAGAAGGLLGGFWGARIAVREGENFARYALVILMAVSGIWLIAAA